MTLQLLPKDFDEQIRRAVCIFWSTRRQKSETQGGSRGNVISGKNLDGFLSVVRSVVSHCGLPETSVYTGGRRELTLPGYYRPTKNWDVVIIHQQRLLAVLELKSQVGSFGNNFNNRTEEVIGSAADLWQAVKKGAYHPKNHTAISLPRETSDPRPPFLGYLMLLERCENSTRPVSTNSPHYAISREFDGSSYADRYQILCEKLMEQNLYQAAALLLSEQENEDSGNYSSLSEATSIRNLFAQLAGQILAGTQC